MRYRLAAAAVLIFPLMACGRTAGSLGQSETGSSIMGAVCPDGYPTDHGAILSIDIGADGTAMAVAGCGTWPSDIAFQDPDQRPYLPSLVALEDWHARPLPVHPALEEDSRIWDIEVISATEAYAVGTLPYLEPSAGGEPPLILRWDGTEWSPMPIPSQVVGILNEIVQAAPEDLWIAGGSRGTGDGRRNVLLHLEDGAWKVVPIPPTTGDAMLSPLGLAFVAADDGLLTSSVYDRGCERPVLARWNGARWNKLQTHFEVGAFHDITFTRSGDPFAIGTRNGGFPSRTDAAFAGWSWRSIPMPPVADEYARFELTPDDGRGAWVVMRSVPQGWGWGFPYAALHWDGDTWHMLEVQEGEKIGPAFEGPAGEVMVLIGDREVRPIASIPTRPVTPAEAVQDPDTKTECVSSGVLNNRS